MVATEPLTENQWNEIGISSGETFADFRNLIIYGQRTADNRIAFGGRGAPYHWGSAIKPEFDINANIHRAITAVLHELLPQTRDYAITHEWGGPLGIHRDWFPSVWWDESLGQGGAGGYVGDGVTTTFLAGRTLAALITGEQSELTTLPWVNHQSQRWEPEPLRWAGANLGLRAMTIADVEEKLTSRPSIAANLFHRFLRN
jgi:glycine/D-amino acid oxidase-like deaminating enzyme